MALTGCLTGKVMAQSATDTESEEATQLLDEGQRLFEEARYDSSSANVRRAASVFKSTTQWENLVRSYNLLASNQRVLSKLDSALVYSEKALHVLEENNLKLPQQRIKALNNLGLIAVEQSDFGQARTYYEKALELAENNSVPLQTEALILGNIGSSYDDEGMFDKALDYYSKGVGLLDVDGPRAHREQLAKLYNYIGITWRKKGQYDKALQFYERELQINTDLYGEGHPAVAGGYNNMGGIYYGRGDFGQAILYFKRAANSIKLYFGDSHPRVGLIYNNIGAVYYEKGEFDKAIDYLKMSAGIKRKSQGKNHPDYALTLNNIGSLHTELGNYEAAIDYLQRSLEIRIQALGSEHPVLSNNYNALGQLYLNTGEADKAIENFKRGLGISETTRGSGHPLVIEGLTNLARAYREQGSFGMAMNSLHRAEELLSPNTRGTNNKGILSNYRYPSSAVNVLREKGKTLHKNFEETNRSGLLKSSLAAYTRLSNLLDAMQKSFKNEESKLLMSSRSHEIYEEAIVVSHELYKLTGKESYLEDVFLFSEKSKARVILELLNNKRARKFAGVPDSLISYEEKLREQLSTLQQQMNAGMNTDEGKAGSESLQDSLFRLNNSLNEHLLHLRKNYPKYHSFKYRTEVPALSQVQKNLSKKNMTMIAYFYGQEHTWALVIDKGKRTVTELPHLKELPAKIDAFKKAIAQKQDSRYRNLAGTLYAKLIEPIEPHIENEKLLLVPDGALNVLPFDALLTGVVSSTGSYSEYPYLLNRYALQYSPSVALSMHFGIDEEPDFMRSFAGFAPFYTDSELERLPQVSSRSNWQALPSSRYEVRQIAETMGRQGGFWASLSGGNKTRVLTGEEATESQMKDGSLNQYRYLHLATHAFTSDSVGGRAGIAFQPDAENREDGILYSEEIYGLNLKNELVVLSACETGTGEIRTGEGIIGLSRAFQYAGAENLLVSLWNVEDRSTAQLMISFYEYLQKNGNTVEALRSAKKNLIQNPAYAHPRYWSPFIFIGN